MKRLLNTKALIAAAGFIVVLLLWILFAPVQIGGNAFYVVINGNSMEPDFYKGDLVVLRTASDFRVGDIVAYKYPSLGNVFHRIVEIKGNSYIMKGDHNTWQDSYQPSKDEIVARYWVNIPKVGLIINQLRSPWLLALLAGIIFFLLGFIMINSSRKSLPSEKNKKLSARLGFKIADWRESYYWIIYAIGLISIVLGIVAFTRPVSKMVKDNVEFQQNGIFTYSGRSDQAVYDTQGFTTGDPVFMALSCKVNFEFQYALITPGDFSGGGTYQLNAALQGTNGWRRNINLTPETEFTDSKFDSKATLDICALRDLINSTESITAVQHLNYNVIVTPIVKIQGQFNGIQLTQTFSPDLTFSIDQEQMYIPLNVNQDENPFQPVMNGYVTTSHSEPNTISIFSLQLPVAAARSISLILILVALLGLAIPMLIFSVSGQQNDKLKAKMLVGPMLVETLASPVSGAERIVDLVTFEDIVQLAERMGTTVFFHQQPLHVDYLVKEANVVYRYRQPAKLLDVKNDDIFINEVHQAITNNEFVLFYQPIRSLEDGKVSQVEALLRWNHPRKGMILAGDFLPQAEQSDAIKLIDQWVIENACMQLRRWQTNGLNPVLLSINISSQQLKDDSLSRQIEDALLENQIPPNFLGIELSLDQLTFDTEVLNNLKMIKKLGVIITVKSIDSNSFDKLHTLETVDQIKLGRPIVGQVLQNEEEGKLASKVIDEAHKKHVDVIAAGVETDEQMGFLRLNACDDVQGYLVSHPLSEKDIDAWLRSTNKRTL